MMQRRAPHGRSNGLKPRVLVPFLLLWLAGCTPTARRIEEPSKPAETSSRSEESPIDSAQQASAQTPDTGVPETTVLPRTDGKDPSGTTPAELQADEGARLAHSLPELAEFYRALQALRDGRRAEPLRFTWLGDSHTAADFMTQRLRERLWAAAGPGGPGFVRLGMDSYRHGVAVFERSGRWRKQPILPAQRTRVMDGVFGYGGIRTIPLSGGSARVTMRAGVLPKGEGYVPVDFSLSVRLPRGAALRVRVAETERVLRWSDTVAPLLTTGSSTEVSEPPLAGDAVGFVGVRETASAGIWKATFRGASTDSLFVSHLAGEPEIFGATLETVPPGVVLDTVGINGARAATPLAWDAQQFEQEIRDRQPELLIVAFGTNEAFDRTPVERYRAQVTELIGRYRTAVPEIPCWIVGPPDASDGASGSRARVAAITLEQASAAEDSGCAFTSGQALMGGLGSFRKWEHHRPAWARSDGIHLSVSGYRELGDRISDALLPSPALTP